MSTRYVVVTNELYHHGIKGQKWGIRRFQNKDGSLTPKGKQRYRDDDIIIEKGSTQRHISGQRRIKLNNRETYLYDPNNKHDKKVYEGAYSMYIEQGKGYANKYIHEYKTLSDLRIPSDKRSIEIFVDSYKKNPARYAGEMNVLKNEFKELTKQYNTTDNIKKIASYDKDFDANTSKEDLAEYGYRTLNALAEYGSSGSPAVRNYYNSIKSEGYNALIDDNNRSVYNDAVQPILVLNAKKTLKEIGVTKQDKNDMRKELNELEEYMQDKYKGKRSVAL